MTPKRYLLHGPRLDDPSELLLFDAWLWPALMVHVRPIGLAPGYVGYPVQDQWPGELLKALAEGGRTLPPSTLLWSGTGADPLAGIEGLAADVAALGADALVEPLAAPVRDAEVRAWLARIDRAGLSIARRLAGRGHHVACKLYLNELALVLAPGWEVAASMVLTAFPRIDRALSDVPTLLRFLADEGTAARREALYAWAAPLARGELAPADAAAQADAAAVDYVQWIVASGLASGTGTFELLWKLDRPDDADALCAVGAAPADRQAARFERRGLAFGALASMRSDCPVALISSRARGYP